MRIIVCGEEITEEEKRQYIQYAKEKFPDKIISKLTISVDGDFIDLHYEFASSFTAYKMGGYLVGYPKNWNDAKRAELRDTITHSLL